MNEEPTPEQQPEEDVAEPDAPESAAEASPPEAAGGKSKSFAHWRGWVPWVLVVVASLILLFAGLDVWVKRQALDTDNFVNASAQMLENPKIRSALSVYIVNQIFQNNDVATTLQQRLPAQLQGLAAPLAGGLQQLAVRTTNALLARPRVQELWRQATAAAHGAFIAVLNGNRNILQTTNGAVVLNLRNLLDQVTQAIGLPGTLVQKLPPDAGQIVIAQGNHLETARKAVKAIRVVSFFLIFLALALYALAIFIARGKRRSMLLWSGVSVAVVGLIILVVRRFAEDYVVNSLTTNTDAKGAVDAAFAIGTQLLRNVGVNALVYGILIIFAAWVAGPSRPATWVRRKLAPTMRNHPAVIFIAVAFGLLLVLLFGPKDAQRIYPLIVLFALALFGVELLRRQTLREFPEAEQPSIPAG